MSARIGGAAANVGRATNFGRAKVVDIKNLLIRINIPCNVIQTEKVKKVIMTFSCPRFLFHFKSKYGNKKKVTLHYINLWKFIITIENIINYFHNVSVLIQYDSVTVSELFLFFL